MNTGKRIAIVTGASRGIGRAIALEFAKQGAFVVINYNGSREKAAQVKEEIINQGGEAEIFQCNVADFTACGAFIKEIMKTYGRIDVLVNNAGITKDGLLMAMSEEDFGSVLDTNLVGTFNCIRHAARQMLKQRSGRIINMASVVGIGGNPGQANYACIESRCDRPYKDRSQRAGFKRNYSKCHCSRLYQNGYDRCTF